MPTYGIAEAKARLSDLIERAERGEEVVIARHGKPVVRLMPAKPAQPVSAEELRAFRTTMPKQSVSTADIIRQLRNEDY